MTNPSQSNGGQTTHVDQTDQAGPTTKAGRTDQAGATPQAGQATRVTDVIEPRQISSRVLGEIQVTEEGTLTFPTGVLGFPEARDFTLVTTSRDGFYWLQSLEHDTLTFLVMDPFLHVPDFSIEIDDEEMGVLGTEASEIIVLAVVTLPAGPEDNLTANLQGPLVINSAKGIGRQLILDDSPYGLRHTLDISAALLAS